MLAKEDEDKLVSDPTLVWDEGTTYEGLLKADIVDWFEEFGKEDQPNDEVGTIIMRMIYTRIDKNLDHANRLAYTGQITHRSIVGEIKRSTRLSPDEVNEYLSVLDTIWASLDIKFRLRYTAEFQTESDTNVDTDTDPADE